MSSFYFSIKNYYDSCSANKMRLAAHTQKKTLAINIVSQIIVYILRGWERQQFEVLPYS